MKRHQSLNLFVVSVQVDGSPADYLLCFGGMCQDFVYDDLVSKVPCLLVGHLMLINTCVCIHAGTVSNRQPVCVEYRIFKPYRHPGHGRSSFALFVLS